ncbi:hypothetical protein N7536_004402 [Penicillium majusculum]|uniref:Uncharacterized protein n=1 Tax=Penicillium solitum TaxID=60172 RepID=A0A1V6R7J7_9EURO|nr:uncharacterized protein PENSOL_c012G04094 [Penicillium solitum]KAJ5693990.1 hypothetical protein N7536_004402 [Penicillium majusculum]OQD97484.1 hypothetical protein PENSOL_c012G04094 [Penicillium solitum]
MVDGEAFGAQVRRRAGNVEALLGQSVGQNWKKTQHATTAKGREQKIRCSFSKQCEKRKEDEEKLELDDIEILKRAGTILQNSIGTSKDPRKVKKTKAAMKCLKQHRKELKNHRRTVK